LSSVDLKKKPLTLQINYCFVFESLHGDVQSGREITLVES